jgi:hypothetical protein
LPGTRRIPAVGTRRGSSPPRWSITARETAWLRTAFLHAARADDATPGAADVHGQRYHLDTSIIGPKGIALVRTTWIVRTGEDFPRLTSCYVL